jgi:hypothetical protein
MDYELNPALPVGLVFAIPLLAISGGFVFLIIRTVLRSRVRELEIRERIAMIERGLVPPPEKDPRGFDRAMLMHQYVVTRRSSPRHRHRRAGVTIMGVGFGLMVLLAFTADIQVGLGVGGFLVVLGLAFFVNSLLDGDSDAPLGAAPPFPSGSTVPPLGGIATPPAGSTAAAPPSQQDRPDIRTSES